MKNRTRIIVALVVFSAILALFNLTGFSNPLRNSFYLMSQPFQGFLGKAGNDFSDFWSGVFRAGDLKKENEEFQLKIKELVGEKVRLQEFKKENESLRVALDLGLEKDFNLAFAKVVGKDVSQDSLLINKGRDDGFSPGLPVITGQRVLIGKIGEVFKNFSKVILISGKENAFDVKIGEKEILGVAKGGGGNLLSLELIPREQEIKEGDFVATAALGNIFPPNLLVGEVRKVEKKDVDPFQRVEVNPAFEFESLTEVFVVLNFQK
ncbi:MAG: rod shape-determining protein MreC [bacterium]|nr:rod shape-determining protein MreC [bacterium]